MSKTNIILCEEVREEANGIKTLIGVFNPSGIKVKKFPFLFPKFSMFMTIEDYNGQQYSFEVLDPKENILVKGDLPKLDVKTSSLQLAINFSPLVFKESGEYLFTVIGTDGIKGTYKFMINTDQPPKEGD
jgi:hypothetical protein